MSSQGRLGTAQHTSTSRPAALTIGVAVGVIAGVAGLLAGVVLLITGRESIEEFISATFGGETAELAKDLIAAEIDEAVRTLNVKAYTGIVVAALVIVFAALSAKASRATRVLYTLVALVYVLIVIVLLVDAEVIAGIAVLFAVVGALAAVVAIPLLFLPAVNRFGKARRSGR